MNNLQDPAISAAERTGYPAPQRVACQCSECDEPIYFGESAYRFSWGWICEQCAARCYEVVEDG